MINEVHLCDCMEFMKWIPDKHYALAIVDPPYGGGGKDSWAGKSRSRFGGLFDRYHITDGDTVATVDSPVIKVHRSGGTLMKKYSSKDGKAGNDISHWDFAPSPEYFEELFRISENQIIWGGNYFGLPPTRCFVVWRKPTISENFSMAMGEYAWCSFNSNAKIFSAVPNGTRKNPRIHPTQKPVSLYKWLLGRYAPQGATVFDSHVGSGSLRIACHDLGFGFEGCEIDPVYWEAQERRFKQHVEGLNPPPPEMNERAA